MLPGGVREFGACDLQIRDRKIQPRPEVRGDVARIYFYMHQAYPGRGIISNKNRKLFAAWSKQDPPDAWECQRAQLIKEFQGNRNAPLEQACVALAQPATTDLTPSPAASVSPPEPPAPSK